MERIRLFRSFPPPLPPSSLHGKKTKNLQSHLPFQFHFQVQRIFFQSTPSSPYIGRFKLRVASNLPESPASLPYLHSGLLRRFCCGEQVVVLLLLLPVLHFVRALLLLLLVTSPDFLAIFRAKEEDPRRRRRRRSRIDHSPLKDPPPFPAFSLHSATGKSALHSNR